MHDWVTVRLERDTLYRLKEFKLVDEETVENTLSRILKAIDHELLVKQVADEVEKRLKKNNVKTV